MLCECDLTLSKDSTKPSMDNGGSGLACGVKVALGILLHEILHEVIERALPTWDAMAVVNAAAHDNNEHAQVERLKIYKKDWRSRCVVLGCCSYSSVS